MPRFNTIQLLKVSTVNAYNQNSLIMIELPRPRKINSLITQVPINTDAKTPYNC